MLLASKGEAVQLADVVAALAMLRHTFISAFCFVTISAFILVKHCRIVLLVLARSRTAGISVDRIQD